MLLAAQKIWLKQGELKNSGIRRSLQGLDPGADLGGGDAFPSGIRPPADPKDAPLYYF